MLASQHRREFKFLLNSEIARSLRDRVAEHLPEDENSAGGYPVLSEYYDSEDRLSYWQKQMGVPSRRKLRTRLYGRADGSIPPIGFIEVKHKQNGGTVKRRVACAVADLAKLSAGELPDLVDSPEAIAREVKSLLADQGQPAVQIRYHRFAYDSGPEGTLRITFDEDIRCRFDIRPLTPDDDDFPVALLDPGESVMEVKTIGAVPYWFRQLIGEFAMVPRGFSKYAAALERHGFSQT